MKKFIMIVLVVLIVALLFITGSLYQKVNDKDVDLVENAKVEELEKRLAELENEIVEKEVEENNEEKEEEEKSKNVEFDSDKMKVKSAGMKYSVSKVLNGHGGIDVEIESGKAYLTTNPNDEMFKNYYFPNVKETVLNQEITGFGAKIKEVHYGYLGDEEVIIPTLFFLLEDGTVEYVNTKKMILNEEYKSFGKIKQVSDIVKFEDATAGKTEEDGGIYEAISTVVAIDKDGYSYDLNELL